MLVLRLQNKGTNAVWLSDPDFYGDCSPYQIIIDPVELRREVSSGPPCAPFHQLKNFNCVIGSLNIEPGRQTEQRVLLNRLRQFEQLGTYTIKATRHLGYLPNHRKPGRRSVQISRSFTISLAFRRAPSTI